MGEQGGAGSPRPASIGFLEPKRHLPLVLWKALAVLELYLTYLLCVRVCEETFKNYFQPVPSLNYLVPQ